MTHQYLKETRTDTFYSNEKGWWKKKNNNIKDQPVTDTRDGIIPQKRCKEEL